MKPPPFEYHAAGSVDEAVALLAEHGDEAKVLAGGQSLLPLLSLRLARPSQIVDVNDLTELSAIENGSGLRLGALVRHREVERSPAVRAANPLVSDAVRFIGHTAIRNRGTIGGSLAHADPAAELPTVALALEATIEVRSTRGSREITADRFFEGFLTTVLEPDELVTAVRVPTQPRGTGWSFREFSRRSGDFAIAGVAATLALGGDGRVAEARLAFSGVASVPIRAEEAERALVGPAPTDATWAEAGQQAVRDLDPPGDLHGSTAYRRHLAAVLAEDALREAHGRAEENR
jgi:aerobic carbon-monoxide dehydrogenase medium subunit